MADRGGVGAGRVKKVIKMSGLLTEARRRDKFEEHQDELKLARERRSYKRRPRSKPAVSGSVRRLLNGQLRRGGRSRLSRP